MQQSYIIVTHVARDPIPKIREIFPGRTLYEITCWEQDIGTFFKSKALLWSRQICTQNTVVVIHSADKLSVSMMSLITGVLDQGFMRPVIFVVQSQDRLPFSIRRKSKIIFMNEEPPLADGWLSLVPDRNDHIAWESILIS